MLATPAYFLLVVFYGSEFSQEWLVLNSAEFLLHTIVIHNVFATGAIYAMLALMRWPASLPCSCC